MNLSNSSLILKVTIGVLFAFSASRLIPHPPNFTSIIALSFYIPAAFGLKFIPVVIISLFFTDLIIGLHSTLIFTHGSIFLIGLISIYFNKSLLFRIFGTLTGAVIFYLVTNFGVWTNGSYGYNLVGLLNCYILALPFFVNTVLSTIVYASIIETIYKFYNIGFKYDKSSYDKK